MPVAINPETPNPPLPDDVAQCHALISELTSTLRMQEREKAQLRERIELLVRKLYGRRSEKFDPSQMLLFAFELLQVLHAETPPADEAEVEPECPPKKKGHGRKKPPTELPHYPIEHPAPASELVCAECGAQKNRIGEKVTEQLEYAPASLFVLEHIQPVYACPCCQGAVVTAPKPAQPIEKGLPGPGLLAQVVVAKYADHLPLHRQERIFERHGADISRKTMCDWVLASASILKPIVDAMKARILESKVIHTDDTPVTVRTPGQTGTHQGRFWVYLGDRGHPYTVYDYTPNRRRDGPATFLEGFAGTKEHPRYLQADAYGGYDGLYTTEEDCLRDNAAVLIESACWAHCRRYFFNASGTDPARSHLVLAWIRLLYDIEREAKTLTDDERRNLRQEKAAPILTAIREWLDAEQPRVLPQSPIGKAVLYALNQWSALLRYTEDGALDIDNNAAERKMRAIALGRKNWIFAGSNRGGHAAAILYSVIESAKDHAVEPFAYLRDILMRIPTHPNKDLHLLLPDHWKQEILPTLAPPPRI